MRKRYYLRIELELHAITCPGVWLCTNGYLDITIKTLGYFFKTVQLEPKFPLILHDKFQMDGYFQNLNTINSIEHALSFENIEISLWQNGRRLSYFIGKLGNIISNTTSLKCLHNINVQVLMNPSHSFPGIIAPKLELSCLVLAHSHRPQNQLKCNCNCCHKLISPCYTKNIYNSYHNHDDEKIFRRQKPVCHIKPFQDSRRSSSSTMTSSTKQSLSSASSGYNNFLIRRKSSGLSTTTTATSTTTPSAQSSLITSLSTSPCELLLNNINLKRPPSETYWHCKSLNKNNNNTNSNIQFSSSSSSMDDLRTKFDKNFDSSDDLNDEINEDHLRDCKCNICESYEKIFFGSK